MNMLNTVLRNLLNNAVKFTDQGLITLSTKKNDDYMELIIEDTGVGISEEVQEKLFDIGFKSSTKGTNNETGTGLGLILCKELVKKNNGSIELYSEKGVGTKITILLPIADSSGEESTDFERNLKKGLTFLFR